MTTGSTRLERGKVISLRAETHAVGQAFFVVLERPGCLKIQHLARALKSSPTLWRVDVWLNPGNAGQSNDDPIVKKVSEGGHPIDFRHQTNFLLDPLMSPKALTMPSKAGKR
jgi:hypothetical protein